MFSFSAPGVPSFGDLSYKAPCRMATVAALPANTRTGSVLTASANGALTIDSLAAVVGDRVLVKNEVTAVNNGIYDVTSAGSAGSPWALTRSSDSDTSIEVQAGSIAWVQAGTWGKSFLAQTATGPATRIPILNTDPLAYSGVAINLGGVHRVVQVYTANATWTRQDQLLGIEVEVLGGGAAGGGAALTTASNASGGSGGGAGGYARVYIPRSFLAGTSYAVVVGAAVAGGTGVGANGNLSSFSGSGVTTVQGNGGTGGNAIANGATVGTHAAGGAGGAASGGDINVTGGAGTGVVRVVATIVIAGMGGASIFGGMVPEAVGAAAGNAGAQYGGGGSGAAQANGGAALAGGGGAAGLVIVTELYGA